MKRTFISFWILLATFLLGPYWSRAQSATSFTVKAVQPVADVQPTMWGIFLENINFGADGGIYAELIKNRSFEFNTPMMGWQERRKGGASSGGPSAVGPPVVLIPGVVM